MHSASGGVGSAVAQLVPSLGGSRRIGIVGRADKVAAALLANGRGSGKYVASLRPQDLR